MWSRYGVCHAASVTYGGRQVGYTRVRDSRPNRRSRSQRDVAAVWRDIRSQREKRVPAGLHYNNWTFLGDVRRPGMNTTLTIAPHRAARYTINSTVLYRIGVLAVLLLAIFLRFYALDQSSLWSDEGNTWAMLDRDFATIAQAAAADIHPPGYYLSLIHI